MADLAHAWGREKGFHHHMTATMCERRGDVERKIRSDRGKDRSSTSERNNKRSLGASASSSGAAIAAAGGTDTMGRPSKRAHRSDGPSPSAVTGMLSAADPDLLGNAAAMAMGGAAL